VVAANENLTQSAATGNHFIRIRAVADRIPQVDDQVVSRRGSEASLERFQVAMNVAEEKDAHGKARIIAF